MVGKKSLLPDIRYHDYAALIAHIDAEQYRHVPQSEGGVFQQGCFSVADHCGRFRSELEKMAVEFARLNEFYASDGKPPRDQCELPNFLYNPASFVTFGTTDNLCLVAVDDFDLAVDLSLDSTLGLDQTTVAFCPKLSSLGLAIGPASCFAEMHELFNGKLPDPSEKKLPQHPFVEERPLVAVTYYRLGGLASIGPGILFQEAAYKAMADKITRAIDGLRGFTRSQDCADLLTQKDVDSFRCLFLDPQGWADIATVMLCRNFSVISSVLMAITSLTFRDLYDTRGNDLAPSALKAAVELFGVHAAVAKGGEATDPPPKGTHVEPLLGDNHIFCTTWTTPGLSVEAFLCSDEARAKSLYAGVVKADPHFNMPPGHLPLVARCFGPGSPLAQKLSAIQAHKVVIEQPCVWGHFGAMDSTMESAAQYFCAGSTWFPLFDLVETIRSMRGGEEPSAEQREWSIQNLLTEIAVPSPVLADGILFRGDPPPHLNPRRLFAKLAEQLFGIPDSDLEKVSENNQRPRIPPFDLEKLRERTQKLRIPSPLCSELQQLFADFSRSLGDVYLFPNVLDLGRV